MEENKGLVGQRIVIVLLLLVVIAIIGFGFYMLKDSDEPIKAVANSENLVTEENKENEKNNEVERNNEVDENIVDSNEIRVDFSKINIIDDTVVTAEDIERIAKNTLTEYLKVEPYENSSIGPMPYLLIRLNLETEENIDSLLKNTSVTDKNEYIKSNVKYEDFKNTLLQVVTDEYFTKNFSQYRDMDGYVAFCDCAGGGFNYAIENVKLRIKNGDTYICDVTFKDVEIYNHYLEGEEYTEEDYLIEDRVEFENIGNRLLISKYNEQITLEGIYSMDASDVSYEFYNNGTVEYSTNMAVFKGFYLQNGENELKISWTEKTEWDPITGEETVKKMSGTEYVDIIDYNNISVRTEVEGKTYSNEFIKLENE